MEDRSANSGDPETGDTGGRPVLDAPGPMNAEEALLLAKLVSPSLRQPLVHRQRLVDRLISDDTALVVVSAPAGSGKSTLLADWTASDPRAFVWVSLSPHDGEPSSLFNLLANGTGRELGIDPAELLASAPDVSTIGQVVPRIVAALQGAHEPLVIVLDNLQEVTSRDSRDALDLLVDHLPKHVQLAVSSREPIWLATPGRRGRGELLELGPAELALNTVEAAEVMEGIAGAGSLDQLEAIMESTEGWAAGVYLACLAVQRQRHRRPFGPAFPAGSAPPDTTTQFMRSEVLSQLDLDDLRFLRRTAVLDLMSAPVCDALVGRGSARMLESLADRNLFVIPVDDGGVWYRSHPLFRAVLLDDLVAHEPLMVPALNARASAWWEVNGSIDRAIGHAVAAAQPGRAAELAARNIIPAYYGGRLHAAESWLRQIGEEAIEANPMLAVLAGWIAALTGHSADTLRWLDRAEHCSEPTTSPEAQRAFHSVRDALRGFVCAHGVDEMADDALRVTQLEPAWSPWRTIGLSLLATARWMQGHLDEAEANYSEAVDVASQTGSVVPLTRVLAYRSLLAMDRHDWDRAADDVERALAEIEANNLFDHGSSANAYAAAARLALHRGDTAGARAALARAMPLRVLVTWASPWASLILRVNLVEAHLGLGDPRAARIVLREIDDVLHLRPALGLLNDRVEQLRDTMSTIGIGAPTTTLSTAELRLLPYLQTHLTMGMIAERLFVSRNTVATHAKSIYKKLGVSSRSDAVRRARELGLLADGLIV